MNPTEKSTGSLRFFRLPEMFRTIGGDNGLGRPATDQVIAVGTEDELRGWIAKKGLNEAEFPIQPSKLVGKHVDIYEEQIALHVDTAEILSFRVLMDEIALSRRIE